MPAQTEKTCPAILGRPQLGKPFRPAQQDMRHASQRLGVINDRRSAPQPDHSWKGRADSGNAALAFERFHQRRLLAHLVGTRSTVPVDLKVVTAAENVLAEKSPRVGVF